MTQQNDKMVLKVLSMECKTFGIYVYILFHSLTCTYEKRVHVTLPPVNISIKLFCISRYNKIKNQGKWNEKGFNETFILEFQEQQTRNNPRIKRI